MTDELEVELKYSASDPAGVRGWLDAELPSPGQAPGAARWSERRLSDLYFDTSDRALAAAGYGVRLRTGDGPPTVTLKADAGTDGPLHRRREIEGPATDRLEPRAWPPSPARDMVLDVAGDRRLVERFVLSQRRLERPLEVGGARVALSLDETEVRHAGRTIGRFDSLEVELRGGKAAALAGLARTLARCSLLAPEPDSKLVTAERIVAAASGGERRLKRDRDG